MNANVTINVDWKFAVALGGSVAASILAMKVDPSDVKDILIHTADACKGTLASDSTC